MKGRKIKICKYEIMYILNPDITNLIELEKKIYKILEENEGKIQEYSKWGVRDLLYPIKKKKKGYYGIIIVNTIFKNIIEFIRISRIEQDILRVLIINTKKEKGYIQSTVLSKTEINKDKKYKKI